MKDIIRNEMKKYTWDRIYFIEEENDIVTIVYFEKCMIIFTYGKKYDSVECQLKNEDMPWIERYSLQTILKSNGVDISELPHEYSDIRVDEYIKKYIEFIYKYLLFVIDGDFSWIKRFNEIGINTNIIYDKLHKSGKFQDNIFETEIYRKMIKGDSSWKTDLEKFGQ